MMALVGQHKEIYIQREVVQAELDHKLMVYFLLVVMDLLLIKQKILMEQVGQIVQQLLHQQETVWVDLEQAQLH